MSLSEQDVAEFARSARLALTAEEFAKYTRDLAALEELASALLMPTELLHPSAAPITLGDMRADSVVEEFSREELLAQAPVTEDGFFVVPRTVEGV